jgi:hypothetical protein
MGTKIQTIAWMPQEGPQTHAIHARAMPELLFGGAKGGGKSDLLLGDYLQDVPTYGPNWQGILFRRSYPELEQLVKRSFQIYPKTGAVFKAQEKTWYWPNGATLKMRFVRSERDVEKYQGHEFQWIGFDELGNWASDYAYRIMLSCLRSSRGDVRHKRIRSSANPGGVGHHWVKELFIEHAEKGYVPLYDEDMKWFRVFIPSRLEHNRLLLQQDPGYADRLKGVGSAALVKAWLEGDWNVIVGAYFTDASASQHLIRPFAIPQRWTRFAGFDWGSAHPFAMEWCAVSDGEGPLPKNAAVVYRECYGGKTNKGWGWHAEKVADHLKALEGKDKPQWRRADPSVWKEDGGPSIGERMGARGLTFLPGDNRRIAGWDQIRARLVGDDAPMLYIFETCTDLWRCLTAAQHDPSKAEDLDTEGDDHSLDALRYALMGRPYARPQLVKNLPIRGLESATFDEIIGLEKEDRKAWI